ncbi:carboxypeptidase regulatory-like domain-containing protein [uncultured Dokdonia sp.]|uniref:carboxypeptidase regulatory-like domain-containing protein n=1 Tax=uncultured Dokdonia sp. TaxID=575653 RepID=UPI002603ECD6|nr:carboxypeptidase regulatory-like domain-containing protein [uncultured Dokdonia sp.]
MKQFTLSLLCVFLAATAWSQTQIKGTVMDAITSEPLPDVTLRLEKSAAETMTNAMGVFVLKNLTQEGDQILLVLKNGFITKRLPIILTTGQTLNLDVITLDVDISAEQQQIGLISLSDNDLNSGDDDLGNFNVSGLLSAGRDAFLSAAAFDWSATFFRPRGLDNANGKVLINGIEMNKQFNGRPQWGNWGGLNDAQRNREFSQGLTPSEYSFGGLAGVTNIVMRASQEREGGRISYAAANASYQGRVMASYNSGLNSNGWAYSVLLARRFGEEGFQDGTLYDANSMYLSVEKKINDAHSLNFTGFYTPNRRGRATAITEEQFDLKGRTYNPFWGYQDGEKRNTREREIEEPVFMLNHYWTLSDKTTINSNLGYQFGSIKSGRVDNGSLRNPAPNYYQLLPSYALQDPNPTAYDFQNAYLLEQDFINDGQFDWNSLYQANANGGNSNIILQDDVIDDSQLSANVIINSQVTDAITIDGNVSYRGLKSENYAQVSDLLGGDGFLDIDNFSVSESQDGQDGDLAQSDVRNPNRVVVEGDRYKYNYDMDATVVSGFAQAQFTYNKVDFYVSGTASNTSYQRTGLYENGNFTGSRSFGPSEKLSFTNGGIKAGATYKLSGRHLIDVNAGYYSVAPGIRNSFSNARQNNDVVIGLESEQIQSVDASYIFRSPIVKGRLTGFYTGFQKGTDIGFFFTQNSIAGTEASFVQEVLTNVERRNIGAELGIEAQVLPTLKLKAAASVGQYTYANNPNIYYTSDDFEGPQTFGDGTTAIKDLHVAGGPERAYQLGFEYRDPEFWNFGLTVNYFSNSYIDFSNLARTANFNQDIDGQPFNDYDTDVARDLLRQTEIDDYFLVNIIGGKSWRVGDYFVGFFATVNNVLDETYITGGFEDSRRANYRSSLEEAQRDTPVFGDRLFFGRGTTYYVNAYVRF